MTNTQLLRIVRHVDLPNHARAERLARFAVAYATVVPPLCALLTWYAIARWLMPAEPVLRWALPTVALVLWLLDFFCTHVLTHDRRWAKAFAAIGAVVGGLIAYQAKATAAVERFDLVFNVVLGAVGGGLVGVFGLFAAMLLHLANVAAQAVGAPLAYVITTPLAALTNLALRLRCPAWVHASRLSWVVRFSRRGIERIDDFQFRPPNGRHPIFVANPGLRRDGRAAEAGIPCFTLAVLTSQPHIVASTMHQALDTVPDDVAMELTRMPVVNPATGLPMMGDTIGGVDVAGNLYMHGPLDHLHTPPAHHPTDF